MNATCYMSIVTSLFDPGLPSSNGHKGRKVILNWFMTVNKSMNEHDSESVVLHWPPRSQDLRALETPFRDVVY